MGIGVGAGHVGGQRLALAYFWPGGHFDPFSIGDGVIVVIFLVAAIFRALSPAWLAERGIYAEESRDKLSMLATQQQALQRVATLVARGVSPPEVFATVTQEVGLLLPAEITRLVRFEADGSGTSPGPGVGRAIRYRSAAASRLTTSSPDRCAEAVSRRGLPSSRRQNCRKARTRRRAPQSWWRGRCGGR